ncbi:anthrone oxygenase family protein [Streptomyces sp. NPDC051320]|uniref:anthrone oxygenase family protein n=1 Tax=Streptomyces sp. NPDC051320 TaxID=3154644 RepID=UPI003431ECA7
MATTLLVLAALATGLYAGFMFAFAAGVMQGLKLLTDEQFMAAMRRINEKVPGPWFLLVFLGSALLPAAALVVPVHGRSDTALWLLTVGLVCAVLSHLVTIAGNIPLNSALAAATGQEAGAVRAAFEARWNRLHLGRSFLSTAAFALVVGSVVA